MTTTNDTVALQTPDPEPDPKPGQQPDGPNDPNKWTRLLNAGRVLAESEAWDELARRERLETARRERNLMFGRECAKRRGRHRSVVITRSRERIFIRYEIGPLLAGTAFGIVAVVAAVLSKVIG